MIPQTERLTPSTLALFDSGLSWAEILELTRERGRPWWRSVLARAEEDGLLTWVRKHRRWRLTDAGRELVARSCRGAA